nr:hypothetical protein [Tanacetum cinerariifolium]
MGQDRQMQMIGGNGRNQFRQYAGQNARNSAGYNDVIGNQQASSSGIQTDSTPVYDSDGSAEVHEYGNCYNNEIFNMFTQEEQYTELLEPISEPQQVPRNDNNVISEDTDVEQDEEIISELNIQLSKEKSTVSFLLEEKKRLKSDFKTCEDELLD